MVGPWKCLLTLTVLFWTWTDADGYELLLHDNGPVIVGSTVTLNATILDDSGKCENQTMVFDYEDDEFPRHKLEVKSTDCEALFHIPFSANVGPSSYRYQVKVGRLLPLGFVVPIKSGRGEFSVTENLNGQLQISQNNTNLPKNAAQITYITTNLEVVHTIELNAPDMDYLNKSAISTAVYWFVDCVYKGKSPNYTFSSNYTESDSQHEVLGIVVANVSDSLVTTPSPVSTTTVIPNVTTPITTTVADTTVSSVALSTNSTTTTVAAPLKTDATPYRYVIDSTYSPDCQQKKLNDLLLSAVQLQSQQKYGYFKRMLLVKEPIENVRTQGKVWIQEGEMLDLQVNCNGSGPIRYCAHFVQGPYNVTGNETCSFDRNLVQCQMQFFHYFREPTNYTLVIIMTNDVSKVVMPIGINIYKVQKQPQISVIVVPVTFSSIAIIIVVFGIAYFFQNRSRYMVEVADFDFANNSDMEYKTFRERLRDAISQAINRTQDYSEYNGSEEQIGGITTPQNQKYGSMQ